MVDVRGMMSGDDRGSLAALTRAVARAIESAYAGAASARNAGFARGWLTQHRLPRPVISIGNLTTGGTGKTPVIHRLASHLRRRGKHVAILARGYKAAPGTLGDEQEMLRQSLTGGEGPPVQIIANPKRARAAMDALAQDPTIDLFLLDDGFQHRSVRRDLDIVLINATSPFGFDHVLPRGLLREPIIGLRRAGAVVVTHFDQVSETALSQIEARIRAQNSSAPIYRASHAHTGLRTLSTLDAGAACNQPIEVLGTTPFFAFAGIGDPSALEQQLNQWGEAFRGAKWFSDHHAYSASELLALGQEAVAKGAKILLTTEKDWAKLGAMKLPTNLPPVWRLDLSIVFAPGHELAFLAQVDQAISPHS